MSAPGHKQKAKEGSRSDWETPRELFDLLDRRFSYFGRIELWDWKAELAEG